MRRIGSAAFAAASLSVALLASGCADGDGSPAPMQDASSVVEEGPGAQPRRKALDAATASRASWGPVGFLPLVPVAISNLPDGRILMWSAGDRFSFGATAGFTFFGVLDPVTGAVSERRVAETGHDMFCPGTAFLPDGRLLINGGIDSYRTTLYDPVTGAFTTAASMNINRSYNASVTLGDGSVFTLGGSWGDGLGNKHGEVWTPAGGWRLLPGVRATPFTQETMVWGRDSHMWTIPVGNGRVLHAGPQVTMHWIDTRGDGSTTPIGPRGDDVESLVGNTVMYDVGRILKVGGMRAVNNDRTANRNAFVIDATAGAQARRIASMNYARVFHNSVVLPDGRVVVVGGQTRAVEFSNDFAVLPAEIFDPVSETFTVLPSMTRPRNYHSVALLLPDGRVLSAGGGLCGGCSTNEANYQVLTPPYLLNPDGTPAARPVLTSAPATVGYGTRVQVQGDASIVAFSMVRLSSTTHTVNHDQRRVPLSFRVASPGVYELDVPTNPGILLPGDWMLFAMNAQGTPSIARIVRVSLQDAPSVWAPGEHASAAGASARIAIVGSDPGGRALAWSAQGLPAGVSIDPSNGVIAGVPAGPGRHVVTVSATNGLRTVATWFGWTVTGDAGPGPNRPPAWGPLATMAMTRGVPASFTVQASDPDGEALTYSATGLPAGLAIAPATGVVSGTPTAAGDFVATVIATDPRGASAQATLRAYVDDAPIQLATVPPVSASAGQSVTYTAQAGGAGLQYRWDFGDGSAPTGFASSPTATHVYGAAGVYTVTLTVRTQSGQTAQQTFVQRVDAPAPFAAPRSSSSLVLERRAGGAHRLWVVNPDNDSVTVIDAATRQRVAEIAVGASPRSVAIAPDGRVWVSNRESSTLSVIDATTLRVVSTVALPGSAQPYGLVIAGSGAVYVALEAYGFVARYDAAGVQRAVLQVGATPRHLAIGGDDARLLVSRFVTPPQPGESTAQVGSSANGQPTGGEVVVVDAASMTVLRTVVLGHSTRPDTEVSGRGVPNYLGAAAISPDGRVAWVPSKQDNVMRGALRDGLPLDFQNTVRAVSSRIDLSGLVESAAARVDHDNASLASAALYHVYGRYLFVALETSRQVAVIDTTTGLERFRFEAGLAPQGLAQSPDGRQLYVHNFMSRSVGVHDLGRLLDAGETAAPLLAEVGTVASERLQANVLRGKQLFYDARDPRLSRDSYMSCASCHADGADDGRVWDLTHLGEGLRNTISLRGRAGGQGRLHWSANFDEVQDFETQIRTLAGGVGLMSDAQLDAGTRRQPLGDRKAGVSADLDALAAYVGSLDRTAGSPYRAPDGSMTADAQAGASLFESKGCMACHGGPDFAGDGRVVPRSIGTLKAASGSRSGGVLPGIDVPTLRDAWSTAPYLHDGSAPTLQAAIRAHSGASLTDLEVERLARFVAEVGPDTPAFAVTSPSEGLLGEYYGGLVPGQGPVLLVRNEAVDFNWVLGSPAATVPPDLFSVRWTGTVMAEASGEHVFQTLSDDGVRLWIDGRLVIDNWTDHGRTYDESAPIVLTAGRRYTVRLEYYERGGGSTIALRWRTPGQTSSSTIPASLLSPSLDTNQGLKGEYYGGLVPGQGPVLLVRNEAVDFNWVLGSPAATVPPDLFSVRWTGTVMAEASGEHVFQTLSDDGVRLWIDGRLVIDNWTDHGWTYDESAPIVLTAGRRYTVRLEYYERGGGSTIALRWRTPGQTSSSTIPARLLRPGGSPGSEGTPPQASNGLLGEYYGGLVPGQGPVLLVRNEAVDFNWVLGSPAATVPPDLFSVRWTGTVMAEASGEHVFQTLSDDGVRLWIDGRLVIDNWTDHGWTYDESAPIVLTAGRRYTVRLEYYERGGGSTIALRWRTPGQTSSSTIPASLLSPSLDTNQGLKGEYYGGLVPGQGPVLLARNEAVDFNWVLGAPGPGLPTDNFSVRWTGWIQPEQAGEYRFRTLSDDGVRLRLGGQRVIDNWTDHGWTYDESPAILLSAGQRYSVELEYYERSGGSTISLQWRRPGSSQFEPVPAEVLRAQ